MALINKIITIGFIAIGVYLIVTNVYPYMQKNTSNPELYTGLALVGLFAIIYVTRGDLFFIRGELIGDVFGAMFK